MQTPRVSAAEIARRVQEVHNLVQMFARRYQSRGVAFDDLVGAGNVGVVEAAYRFDPARGVKFGTYAAWWIRKAIMDSLQSGASIVAVPRYTAHRRQRVMEAMKRGRSSGERDRSLNDVAAELGLSDRQARRAVTYSTSVVSMHAPVTGDSGHSWEDTLARPAEEGPEALAMDAERERAAREALQALSPRQRRVVMLRYGGSGNDDQPTPLKEVGRVMGLSRERIRQIESDALEAVRRKLSRDERTRSQQLKTRPRRETEVG
jgi:RNA polymerase primary sigma factor